MGWRQFFNCRGVHTGTSSKEKSVLPHYQKLAKTELSVISAAISSGQGKAGVERGPDVIIGKQQEFVESIRRIPLPSHSPKFVPGGREPLWKDVRSVALTAELLQQRAVAEEQRAKQPQAPTRALRSWQTGSSSLALHEAVREGAAAGRFVLTLGGDHSLALGSISAIQAVHRDVGVVWVDAHADINTAATTPSGNLHGCPVSLLLGLEQGGPLPGYQWLPQQQPQFVPLKPSRVVYIGLRDVDEGERSILSDLGILSFSMREVTKYGIAEVVARAVQHIDPSHYVPIHCSFDIDALDPLWAPSTGTPVPGGLSLADGIYLASTLAESGRLVSFDLTEVNPALGSASDVSKTVESARLICSSALGQTYLH